MAADLIITLNGTPTPVYLGENTALAMESAEAAAASAAAATAAKDVAEAAALTLPNVFASTADGLAAVGANETFWVYAAGQLSLYRKVGGVAVLLDSLPLANSPILKRAFGITTTQSIDTNLAGAAVPATLGPVFIGHNTSGADAITIDTADQFPGGIAFRRSLGTLASPSVVTAGVQFGYLDFRGYNDNSPNAQYFNAASIDVKVYGALEFAAGEPPRTGMHFYITGNNDQAKEALRLIPHGGNNGFGGYFGALEADGSGVNVPPGGSMPRLFAATRLNDWTAMVHARPTTGDSFGLRIDTVTGNLTDMPLAIFGAGSVVGSWRGDGTIIASRLWIGATSAPAGLNPKSYIYSDQTDWAVAIKADPTSGDSYGQRIDLKTATVNDYGMAVYGAGSLKFSIRGDGSIMNNVGIGTAPHASNPLHIMGAAGATAIRMSDSTNGLLGFFGSASGLAAGAPATSLMLRAEGGLEFSGGGNVRHLSVDSTGNILMGGSSIVITSSRHFQRRSYTVGTLPTASPAGQEIYVSNEVGGATPAFSDGTNWRRVADRAVVA